MACRRLSLSRVLGGNPEKDEETKPCPGADTSLMGIFYLLKAIVSGGV